MADFEDSISVFNFSKRLESKLLRNKIYFVSDLILLNKYEVIKKLRLSNLLSEDLIEGVHSKGLMFIDELSVDNQMNLITLIKEEQNKKQVKYISDISIYDMGLSTRSTNALARRGLYTLSNIVDLDIYDLERTRDLGDLSLKEVVDKVHSYGLLLRNESTKECNVIVRISNDEILRSKIEKLSLKNEKLSNVVSYKEYLLKQYMLHKQRNDSLSQRERLINERIISILLDEMVVALDDGIVDDNKIKKLI